MAYNFPGNWRFALTKILGFDTRFRLSECVAEVKSVVKASHTLGRLSPPDGVLDFSSVQFEL